MIREGARETVREGRHRFRLTLQYGALWQGRYYAIKQVAPVIVEEAGEENGTWFKDSGTLTMRASKYRSDSCHVEPATPQQGWSTTF